MDENTIYYYEFLGLELGATENDVMQAYKRKAKLYHPDLNTSKNAQEIMKELNLARDEVLKYIQSDEADQNQSHCEAEWDGNNEDTGDTQPYEAEDNSYYVEWQYGDDNSYNLWLNRGRCSENVWMWGIIPLIMPYAYYKVGMGWRGIWFLIAAVLFATLIGRVGAIWIMLFVYGLFETRNIAKEYNRVYADGYPTG
ncbi:Chaperone protein DnaJ [Methanosarcinales archaeon]|nr:Chaperone protein DnaJ [Methanosarcinales archaeon]